MSTQILACSQHQRHTVLTCGLSQAKTTEDIPVNNVHNSGLYDHVVFLLFEFK